MLVLSICTLIGDAINRSGSVVSVSWLFD
jgi:hypothetical protein